MPRRRLDVPKAKEDVCSALKAHNTVITACKYAGIDQNSFYRWVAKDRDFRDAVLKAEANSDVRLVSIILREAADGCWTAAAWLLERHPRTKHDWKRLNDLDLRKLTTEQILQLAEELERRVDSPGDRAAVEQGAGGG